jgi:hypothetical protein
VSVRVRTIPSVATDAAPGQNTPWSGLEDDWALWRGQGRASAMSTATVKTARYETLSWTTHAILWMWPRTTESASLSDPGGRIREIAQ